MMSVSAINTVEIHAAQGRSGDVCAKLPRILETLLNSTECIAYSVADHRDSEHAWIVSGYWKSTLHMHAHFSHPELMGFMDMLTSGAVSRINFNSFIIDAHESTHHVD